MLLSPADSVTIKDATSLIRPEFQPLARALSVYPSNTPTTGNEVQLIYSGADYRELVLKDFSSAKELIEIECLLFGSGTAGKEVEEVLAGKASEGVTVRYIHDNISNFFNGSAEEPQMTGFYDRMNTRGIQKRDYTPLLDLYNGLYYPALRNHRKVNVIDGRVAYMGGMNLNNGSLNVWGDTHMRITGPAANCLHEAFLRHWNKVDYGGRNQVPGNLKVDPVAEAPEHGLIMQTVPDGPDEPAHMAQSAYIWVLDHARNYVWMETPYLVMTKPLLKAMERASKRGVDVCMLIPAKTDEKICEPLSRYYSEQCMKAGVRMLVRPEVFDHSKVMIADDYLSCVSSTNLDKLSLKRLAEMLAFMYDEDMALVLKERFLENASDSYELTPEITKTWSLGDRLLQNILRPIGIVL